ncbi:MAG: DUF4164 family protein [Rhizobiales bacterium]|nr:DUF4164 family protein [Hyphomicrobiales bacterium]
MADTHKLDEALDRFEGALRAFEGALARRTDGLKQASNLAGETAQLRLDRTRLAAEIEQMKAKAAELVDANQGAVGRIDTAMSRIRAVLHSNSGG